MQLILSNSDYTFDASTKKITLLTPYDTLGEENILRILNLTTYAMIYDCDRAGYSISVTAGVITHTYGLVNMTDADVLQIEVDDSSSISSEISGFGDTFLFDDFNDESLSTTLWGTAVVTGSTTVTESSDAPNTLRVYNAGGGTTGSGYIPSLLTFSRNVSVRTKIEISDGEAAGDGEQCHSRIELYEDSDNYIYFGAYRDTSAAVNSRGYITYNIDDAGATNVDVDTTDLDNIAREYRIDVTEENILFYIDDIIVYTLQDAAIDNFYVRLYAATENNADVIDIRFDYVKVLRLSEDRRIIQKTLLQIQGGSDSIGTLVGALDDTLDIGSSRASTVMDGSEQTLYENSETTPFIFNGGFADFTGCNVAGGEDTELKCYVKIKSGGTYRLIYEETYLAAALPDPICVPVPRLATDVAPAKFCNMYGVKVTAKQLAVGVGWNTIDSEFYDEVA